MLSAQPFTGRPRGDWGPTSGRRYNAGPEDLFHFGSGIEFFGAERRARPGIRAQICSKAEALARHKTRKRRVRLAELSYEKIEEVG